jgi:Arc/MetJ family transcription regulator
LHVIIGATTDNSPRCQWWHLLQHQKMLLSRNIMNNTVTYMQTPLALDDALVAKAQAFTGLTEKSALVREALKALIERESAHRLALLGGSDPEFESAPRRQSEQM